MNEKILPKIIVGNYGALNFFKVSNGHAVQDPRNGGIYVATGEGDLYNITIQLGEELAQHITQTLLNSKSNIASVYMIIQEKPLVVFDEKAPAQMNLFGNPFSPFSNYAGDRGADHIVEQLREQHSGKKIVNPYSFENRQFENFILLPPVVTESMKASGGNVREEDMGDGKVRVSVR